MLAAVKPRNPASYWMRAPTLSDELTYQANSLGARALGKALQTTTGVRGLSICFENGSPLVILRTYWGKWGKKGSRADPENTGRAGRERWLAKV